MDMMKMTNDEILMSEKDSSIAFVILSILAFFVIHCCLRLCTTSLFPSGSELRHPTHGVSIFSISKVTPRALSFVDRGIDIFLPQGDRVRRVTVSTLDDSQHRPVVGQDRTRPRRHPVGFAQVLAQRFLIKLPRPLLV